MSEGGHMGIWHNWAVYRRAQVIYGAAIVERKGVKDGVNGGKSDRSQERCSPYLKNSPTMKVTQNWDLGSKMPEQEWELGWVMCHHETKGQTTS